METNIQSKRIVDQTVEKLNSVLPVEQELPNAEDTRILGEGALLDSMGFVNFVVALEECLEEESGLSINVAEEIRESGATSFRTLGDVGEWVSKRINSQ